MTYFIQSKLRLFVATIISLGFFGAVSPAFTAAIGFTGFVSAPSGDLLSTQNEKIISFSDNAAIRLNIVNSEAKKARIRLRVYDENQQQVQTGELARGILVGAHEARQVIMVFPIGRAHLQNMRVCAQLSVGGGRWVEKSCSRIQVQRVPELKN